MLKRELFYQRWVVLTTLGSKLDYLYFFFKVHTAGYPIASGDVSTHVQSLRQVAQLAITKLGTVMAKNVKVDSHLYSYAQCFTIISVR